MVYVCKVRWLISDLWAILYANANSKYESLVKAIAGLVFLGTPFRGSKWQPLAEALAFLMRPVGSHRGITGELAFNEPALDDILHRFCGVCNRLSIDVACFCELRQTDYGRRLGIAGVVKGVVCKHLENARHMLTSQDRRRVICLYTRFCQVRTRQRSPED